MHIEHELILKMTEPDPNDRPTAEEIQLIWLPLLQHEIAPNVIPRELLKLMTLLALFHQVESPKSLNQGGSQRRTGRKIKTAKVFSLQIKVR